MRHTLAPVLALLLAACGDSSDPTDGNEDDASSGGGRGGGGEGGAGGSGGSGAGSACGPVLAGPRCLDAGLCWDGPISQTVHFEGIDGTPDGASVWAVGTLGGAYRRCEGAWLPMDTGTEANLLDVWHPTPELAVAVGEGGTVLRWDGATWSRLEAPTTATLRTVWGAAPDDVWIGGDADETSATLFHFDGESFERVPLEFDFAIHSIDGHDASQVFAVGGSSGSDTSMIFDGLAWQFLPGGHGANDLGIFTEVVALANGTTLAEFEGYNTSAVYRFQDGDWSEVLFLPGIDRLSALTEDGGGRAQITQSGVGNLDGGNPPYTLLQSEAGDDWTPTGETFARRPVASWARPGSEEAWGAGERTTLLERGAGVWTQVLENAVFPDHPRFVGGPSDDDLWVLGSTEAAHRGATGWTVEPLPITDPVLGYAIAGAVDLAGAPWILTQDGTISHRPNVGWTSLPKPSSDGFWSFLPSGAADVWAADPYGIVSHWDGSQWVELTGYCDDLQGSGSSMPSGQRFRRAPDGVVWLVGAGEAAFALTSTSSCTLLRSSNPVLEGGDRLADIAWTPSGELWAISVRGVLLRREGTELVPKGNVFESTTLLARDLTATPSGKLRLHHGDEIGGPSLLATIDPASGPQLLDPVELPTEGQVWAPLDDRAVFAIHGGVLRHGYPD